MDSAERMGEVRCFFLLAACGALGDGWMEELADYEVEEVADVRGWMEDACGLSTHGTDG
jgi:hypothetical protein